MATDRSVNWAIVGLGDIARKRALAAIAQEPNSSIYACVTRDPQARKADLESFSPRKVYRSVDRMLADPRVDAVYLATPVYWHAPHAIASLKAGKDVLVEKPMALNVREADEVRRIAHEAGRRLAVAYYRRFWSCFQLVKDMLDRGEFGQVVHVGMALDGWYRPDPEAPGAWRTRAALAGGGVLCDVASHRLDLLSWWFGLPRRLVADVRTATHGYDVEDSASILMEFPDGIGFTGSFHWNSKTRTDRIHVVGTEARVSLSGGADPEVVIARPSHVERCDIARPENYHQPLIDDFAVAVVEDRPPRFSGDDGVKATQIIEAAYRSSREKAWVAVR